MIYEVAVGDKVRTVAVVRKGGVLHVELDGRTHLVDARRVNDAVVSLLVPLSGATARVVDAAFSAQPSARRSLGEGGSAGDFDVHLDGRTIAVQIRPEGSFGRQKKEGTAATATGPQRVTSPMPGKVVRVLVKSGDAVTARQGLAVVEAMKMENELRAARDGRVRDVAVVEGQSVDAGALLLIVE